MSAFATLPSGAAIFLDANTLVYHFQPHPALGTACTQLLTRIELQDVLGYTSTHILSEVAHRLMMIEAAALPGWKPTKVKRRLLQQPAALGGLTHFQAAIDTVLHSKVQVLTIAPPLILAATRLSRSTGLLSNHALLVAVMQAKGLTNLASSDADFDRVPGLTRYTPL
jgi:predicted nucleic acid-binding protein